MKISHKTKQTVQKGNILIRLVFRFLRKRWFIRRESSSYLSCQSHLYQNNLHLLKTNNEDIKKKYSYLSVLQPQVNNYEEFTTIIFLRTCSKNVWSQLLVFKNISDITYVYKYQ